MSAEQCSRLFEPCNRLGQALGPIEGTGIGLRLTRGLVTLMGITSAQLQDDKNIGFGSGFVQQTAYRGGLWHRPPPRHPRHPRLQLQLAGVDHRPGGRASG